MNTALAEAALAPRTQVGRYEVLTKLAAGGMAEVYAARVQGTLGFSRLLALKLLYPNLVHEEQFLTMFLDEARLAARIHHPNVAATLDVGDSEGGIPYLVMEYIEGDHLGQILGRADALGERLPVPIAMRIVSDALNGLAAAHQLCDDRGAPLNLVHRDISPHNIMVGCDGVARLTDFGVAKAEDRLTQTRTGIVKGKLSYMAPESASSGHSDARSDLFSMGIVLWESLTGQRLFRGENAAQTLQLILHAPIPAPSSVDPALAPLDALLARALDRDPDKRFQTADAFLTELEQVARKAGRLGSHRLVGKLVSRLMHDKLERERALIEAASSGREQAARDDSTFVENISKAIADGLAAATNAGSSHATATRALSRPPRNSAAPASDSRLTKRDRRSSAIPVPPPMSLPPPPMGAWTTVNSAPASFGMRAAVLIMGFCAFSTMLWLTAHSDDAATFSFLEDLLGSKSSGATVEVVPVARPSATSKTSVMSGEAEATGKQSPDSTQAAASNGSEDLSPSTQSSAQITRGDKPRKSAMEQLYVNPYLSGTGTAPETPAPSTQTPPATPSAAQDPVQAPMEPAVESAPKALSPSEPAVPAVAPAAQP